jgi:Serine aminopeptidase, S33
MRVALLACAAVIAAGTTAIAGAEHGDETFFADDSVILHGQWWRPAGEVRAIVVVEADLGHVAEGLAARGYAVYALDLRDETSTFHEYVDDTATWIARVRRREPGKPLFVAGRMRGGLVAALYGEEHASAIAGVALIAPALGLDAPPIEIAGRDAAGPFVSDPLGPRQSSPHVTTAALLDGIRAAWAGADRLTAPLLVVHDPADARASPAASRDFLVRAGSSDKRYVVHGERVEGELAAWLDAHTGAPALLPPEAAPERLPGERGPGTASAEIGAVIVVTSGARSHVDLRAGASPGGGALAWHGALDLRVGTGDNAGLGVTALPVGVARRLGRAGELSLAAGVSAGWPGDVGDLAIPARLQLDLPLGPTHLLARVTASRVVRGAAPPSRTLGADAIEATAALRLGGDRAYWSQLSAGSGPFVGVTWLRSGGADTWGIALGLHLWGAD